VAAAQAVLPAPADTVVAPASLGSAPLVELIDDRDSISSTDRVVLIVEDDPTFGGLLLGLARSAGLKGVLSNAGSGTLSLARKLVPDAITLDLGLSDIDGWVLFDLLRHDQKTRGIPIHVISGAEDIDSLARKGASSISTKPVSSDELMNVFQDIHSKKLRIQRRVLVADPDPERRLALVEAIRDGVTSVTAVGRFAANADEVGMASYDAIVLGFGRSAKDNAQALDEVTGQFGDALPQLLFFAPHPDALEQVLALNPALANAPRAENFAQLALHISATLPGEGREEKAPATEENGKSDLAGAKVLIVDDDIRNIYSLTSVLETYDIQVLHAERGRDGIALLEQTPDVDAALIDIMMPEMDGYETMRRIRGTPAIAHIPLISVTAKAMKGDRQKCLDAGASDYIAKPVDLDLLLALLRVWIGRSRSRVDTSEKMLMAAN
jgi:CheY-like chemotaxis protein